jgi:hypothetical protein
MMERPLHTAGLSVTNNPQFPVGGGTKVAVLGLISNDKAVTVRPAGRRPLDWQLFGQFGDIGAGGEATAHPFDMAVCSRTDISSMSACGSRRRRLGMQRSIVTKIMILGIRVRDLFLLRPLTETHQIDWENSPQILTLQLTCAIGNALLHIQNAELALQLCAYRHLPHGALHSDTIPPEWGDMNRSKLTIGQLIREIRLKYEVHPQFEKELLVFLDNRNLPIHKLHTVPGYSFKTNEGRRAGIHFAKRWEIKRCMSLLC